MDDQELRTYPLADFEIRRKGSNTVEFRGYAAVFDQWSEPLLGFKERVRPGAFDKTIAEGDVAMLFNHDVNFPLARSRRGTGTLRLSPDSTGLHSEASWDGRQSYVNDLAIAIERRDVDSMSFTFQKIRDAWDYRSDPDFARRDLQEVRLGDVSPVVFPAYPQTTAEVRSLAARFAEERATDASVGGGVDRKNLPKSDFCFPEDAPDGGFPIVTPGDVSDAVHSWGRYKGPHSFEEFKQRLTAICKRKGEAFMNALPKSWSDDAGRSLGVSPEQLLIAQELEARVGKTLSNASRGQIQSALDTLRQLLDAADPDGDGDILADDDGDGDGLGMAMPMRSVEMYRRRLELMRLAG